MYPPIWITIGDTKSMYNIVEGEFLTLHVNLSSGGDKNIFDCGYNI